MPLQRAIGDKLLPAWFAFVQPNGGIGWQMVPKLYSLVIAFVTNLTDIYKFLFMFIFDIKLQTKSTFKFFPTSVAKPVRFFASALNWMHPFDMLIQIIFETSVITTVFAIVDMSQLLCEHLFFGRLINYTLSQGSNARQRYTTKVKSISNCT